MKSYVSMENRICPVCCVQHSHGCSVIFNKKLKDILDPVTTTGWGMCEEHAALEAQGFVALVGISNGSNEPVNLEDAKRTGRVAHFKRESWDMVFDSPAPKEPLVFTADEVIQSLEELHARISE